MFFVSLLSFLGCFAVKAVVAKVSRHRLDFRKPENSQEKVQKSFLPSDAKKAYLSFNPKLWLAIVPIFTSMVIFGQCTVLEPGVLHLS